MSEPNGAADAKTKKPKKGQKKFAIGAAIIVGAIGYLMYAGVQASSVYYFTVDEVLSMNSTEKKMALRMEGKVKPGSIEKDMTSLKLSFKIIDDSMKSIPVYYQGTVPDMFQDDIDVVVEGKFSSDGRFVANRLLTSCPSKYEAAEELQKSL
ncbi:hypothetical protein MNBD_NITROSPINAE02-156 [hydrothermal vent metagenome]|uniref:Cytochrome c-type biogenesis protein CcmE, heme chaperone n=1 Tax=hydrothermal vent metagenome TaxID=652676 RepID=A0A3B1BZT7_9ZZZZ